MVFFHNWLVFIPGAVVIGMGLIYILIYFGQCRQIEKAMDEAEPLAGSPLNPY